MDIIRKKAASSGSGTAVVSETTVSTTDATLTTIDTIAIPTDEAVLLKAEIVAIRDTAAEKAGLLIEAIYANNSGTVTLQGAVNYIHRQVPAGWDVTFVISGTNVLIRVVGNAGVNIDWKCVATTLGV